MTLYYSASTSGFYDDEIHTTIPSDAVVITKEEHTALLTAQSEGQIICTGTDGRPTTKLPDRIDLPTYKRQAKDKIDAFRKEHETAGMSYVFPDSVTDIVQLRDDRDLLNISSLVTSANLLKVSGYTGKIPFQALSDDTHEMSPDELIAMGLAVAA